MKYRRVIQIPSLAWFALYTRHQHEKVVAQLLTGKGVQVFLPLYGAAHRWNDRIKQLSLPLFPNYVFVFAGPDRRGPILSTPGVYDFVRVGGVPVPVAVEEIEAVRTAAEHGRHVEPHPFLKSGDRVRVKWGPLEGLEGILIRKKNFYRLVVSVDLLVRSVSVEVEVADVERVTGQSAELRFASATAGLGASL
jgi:transcription termination/antitermination protein NusG